jgi:SpoVK/Ycf46/Vps4 family AAA+-type ATPase
MLEMMDDLKRNVKLLAATANNKSDLSDAMLRPGRFDELIEFRHLEPEIIKEELGPENVHLYGKVKKWPIVYIQELVTRRRFMSEKDAMASLSELQKRVDALKKYGSSDDEEAEELSEPKTVDDLLGM